MNFKRYTTSLFLMATVLLLWNGCDRCKDGEICYDVPATYSFENVNYSGQTARLNMMEEMTTYMKTANTPGVQLDANVLKEMYANEGNHFSFTADGKQLKNKTFSLDVAEFEGYMDAIAQASASNQPGSNGVAGVVQSNDGTKQYLFDANGFEHTQLIEKGLMGAVFYYQAVSVYLSQDRIGEAVDNQNVVPGEGTDMEHHWDEAFGYLGVPTDFPGNTNGIRFHGKYADSRDGLLGCNKTLMDAFVLGRAAISNEDHDTKWNQVDVIRNEWERVIAATAIHYLNGARADLADDALRNHQLSEAVAFVKALKYNPFKKISTAQLQQALDLIGDNLYEASAADLLAARDLLADIHDLNSVKEQL